MRRSIGMMAGLLAAVLILAVPVMAEGTPVYRIGDHIYGTTLESPHPYPGSRSGKPEVVWTDHFEYAGAKYIIFEFESFDLAPGDWLEVRDPAGTQVHRYEGKGFKNKGGGFLSRMVFGPEALIVLYSTQRDPGHPGYRVTRISRGYSDAELKAVNGSTKSPESICGADDKRDAACYESTYPSVYDASRAVCRIVMDGSALCTGWLVSCENHLITNNHCTWDDSDFDTQGELDRMEFQFMYEDATCGGGSPSVEYSFTGGTWLENHHNLDYTLIQAPEGEDPSATYGYIPWDIRVPAVDELMYIVGHPAGRPKELSFESTDASDPTGFAEVYSLDEPPCVGGTHLELGYFADTEGGNSGSAVLSRSNDRAIGLHHCGGCPNTGMRIVDVWANNQAGSHPLPPCTITSSVGAIALDGTLYRCASTVTLEVSDDDLAETGTLVVEIWSGTEATPEPVTLTETPLGSAVFTGTIALTAAAPAADGLLSVADGDTITARYIDADDGAGGTDVPRTDTAAVDCAPPVISNVHAVVSSSGVDILWDTDTPADSAVTYGLAPPPATGPVTSAALVTSHSVHLNGLEDCTPYVYFVASADAGGNAAMDDNGGAYYTFTTGVTGQPIFTSTDVPKSIPDSTPAGATSVITVTDTALVEDVNVTISLTHTYDGDMDIYLVGPDGTQVELTTDNGGSGDNFVNTTFDDQAQTAITAGAAPFTGSFRPEQPLSALNGQSAAGTWTLRMVDDAGGDLGTLTAWSLQLTYPLTLCGTSLTYTSYTLEDLCTGTGAGSGDGAVDPGETVTLPVTLSANGTAAATGVTATLSSSTPGVTVLEPLAYFPDIAAEGQGTSLAPHFSFFVDPSVPCGTDLAFDLVMTAAEGSWTGSFTVPTGVPTDLTLTPASTDVPKSIPDSTPAGATSVIQVTETGAVLDVNVTLSITHTWDSDLDLYLIGPDGTQVELSTDNGSSGDNYTGTTLDDEAATAITAGTAPFSNAYRPEQPLSALDGISAAGTWTLRAVDDLSGDVGTLTAWSLTLTLAGPPACQTCTPPCTLTCTASADLASGTAPLAVQFTGAATPSFCLSAPTYAWDFGDGGSSTDQNPLYTYTTPGTFAWTLTVTADETTCVQTGSVWVCPVITVAPAPLPDATVAVPYSQALTASGGTAPYTYALTSGALPTGFTFTSAGLLSGTTTAFGAYPITVTVTDAAGCTTALSTTFTVVCPVITLNPATLPAGVLGAPYSEVVTATGGVGACTFAVTAGALPPGLTLAPNGTLSGTLAGSGSYSFTVTATDTVGCTGSITYSFGADAFNLSFLDDYGRSQLCLNTYNHTYSYTVFSGAAAGTYTGPCTFTPRPLGTTLVSASGRNVGMQATYSTFRNTANASLSVTVAAPGTAFSATVKVPLYDSDILDSPPCGGGEPTLAKGTKRVD